MPDRIPITEAGLRDALRDPRYWKPGPEREAYAAWVTDGFKAMYNSGEARNGTVHVRAYDRKRDGKVEHVGAHTRSPPPDGLVTPTMATIGKGIEGGGRLLAPLVIPPVAKAIQALPRPDLSGLFPLLGTRRPSLLDPPEGGGRRLGTVNGAQPIEVPDEAEPTPGTIGGAVQNAPPVEDSGAAEPRPGSASAGAEGGDTSGDAGLRPSPNTVEGLREASTYKGKDNHGTDIWDAGGNEDQRDADLQALRPGPMRPVGDGKAIGYLPDGRQVMTRPSSRFSDGEPTLEVSRPDGVSAQGKPRYTPTDKIRYRPGRG